ncbi:methyl-accepting chemotaxis protein [Sphaerotilus sp.]|uniref:methyl-accepting chemotaxis protein n=1 Tax=Sphaerotilus sp. TaxID=2093942 RepID=UPI0034E24A16
MFKIKINNMNVGSRVGWGFAAVLALMLAISTISVVTLNAMRHQLATVTGEDAERLRLANTMRDRAAYLALALRDVVMQDDLAFKKKELALMKKAREDYDATALALASGASGAEVKIALDAAATALDAIKAPTEKALDRSMSEDLPGASATVREDVRPAQLAHLAAINQLVSAVEASSQHRAAASGEQSRQALGFIVGLAAAALAMGVGISGLIQRSIRRPLAQALELAEAVAAGDLSRDVAVDSSDEIGRLLQALRTATRNLGRMMQDVRGNAERVSTASTEIAQGNANLSQRTEQQAAALQQTAATMEQLGSTVTSNADNAQQANALARSASEVAVHGGVVVGQVVDTMRGINESSRRISDIIGTIDSIAFQTNILALNAAVEAARAGEQGRGFAVVASEVRTLAQRSADAAREIKGLIGASVERVERGTSLVEQAGATMTDVVASIQRVSSIVAEISAASIEQSTGVRQVGEAVGQMDQVTQQNAALVEQGATAAESLSDQARQLVQAVAVFKLAAG